MKLIVGIFALMATVMMTSFQLNDERIGIVHSFFQNIKTNTIPNSHPIVSKYVATDEWLRCFAAGDLTVTLDNAWKVVDDLENRAVLLAVNEHNVNDVDTTRVVLTRENSQWKIYSLQHLKKHTAKNTILPNETELKQLIKQTMVAFVNAVEKEDVTDFYRSFANSKKAQFTKKDLEQSYQSYVQGEKDLRFLLSSTPDIDYRSIIKGDYLLVSGSFENKKGKVYFSQKYTYEGCQWKLVKFEYNNKF